jgi:hypothetical protein
MPEIDLSSDVQPEPTGFIPFSDLNAVPSEIAIHQGARLTLDQVNNLIPRAYELGSQALPNMGAAWVEFRNTHQIDNNMWVAKNGDLA